MLSRFISALQDNIPARALQISNIIRFVLSLLVGIIWIKMGVDKVIVGRLEFFLFLSMILSNIWIFGFKNGLISYFEDITIQKKNSIFFSIFILLSILGIAVGGLTWVLGQTLISDRLIEYQLFTYLGWLCIYIGLTIPASLGDYFLLIQSQYRNVVLFNAFFSIFHLIVMVVPFLYGIEYSYVFAYLVGMMAIKYLVTLGLSISKGGAVLDCRLAWTYALFSLPLILHVSFGLLQNFVDGWIVSTFFSEEMFANFRYGAKELPFSLIFVSGLVASMIPSYKQDRQKSLTIIKRETSRLIKLLFTTGAGLMFLSPILFTSVYDETFAISAQIFNIYILILLSRVLLPHVVIYGQNKNWILIPIVILELLVNIGLSLLLLPEFGILGIAFATVVANMVEKLCLSIYVYRTFSIPLKSYVDFKTYTRYSLLLVAAFGISLWIG